jgi:hypothetical protein
MPENHLLQGFADELIKIAWGQSPLQSMEYGTGSGTNPIPPKRQVTGAHADRFGTGVQSAPAVKPIAAPMAPRFGAPPGLKTPRLPNPLKWSRPGVR